MQNVECGMQNAECGMWNAEWGMKMMDGVRRTGDIDRVLLTVEEGHGVVVTGVSGSVEALAIPAEIGGRAVVGVGDSAFRGRDGLVCLPWDRCRESWPRWTVSWASSINKPDSLTEI